MSAPFRITSPEQRALPARDLGAPGRLAAAPSRDQGFRSYLDRLLKMIPAEVVSLYVVGSGVIPEEQPLALVAWTVICLIAVVGIRAYGTADPEVKLPTDWTHVGISAGAYMIWVYSLGGPFKAYDLHVSYLGSLLVLAWTFVIPMIYQGPEDAPRPVA